MTGILFDYYDTSDTDTVLKFRLEGPVLDNCGFAMVNRQLWFGLSIRQQLRHNWRSTLPNPYNGNFEIEVEVRRRRVVFLRRWSVRECFRWTVKALDWIRRETRNENETPDLSSTFCEALK